MSKLSKNIGYIGFPKLGEPTPHDSPMPVTKDKIPDRYKVLGMKPSRPAAAMQASINDNPAEGVPADQVVNSGFIDIDNPSNKKPSTYNANVHHESQHSIFNRVRQVYGTDAASNAIEKVISVLSPNEKRLLSYINVDRKKYKKNVLDEEAIAHMQNYLQDGLYRNKLHTKLELNETQARNLQIVMSSAWKKMRKAGEALEPKDLQKAESNEKNLVVHHNISEEGLKYASKTGLIAPSIAISRKDAPLSGFGDITLVGGHDLIDPKLGNPTFDADVYTPRQPRAQYGLKTKEFHQVDRSLDPHRKLTGLSFDLEDAAKRSDDDQDDGLLKYAYLANKGVVINPPQKDVQVLHPWVSEPEFKEFIEKNGFDQNFEIKGEYHKNMSQAARKAMRAHAARQTADKELQDTIADSYHYNCMHNSEDGYTWIKPHRTSDIKHSMERFGTKEVDKNQLKSIVTEKLKDDVANFEKWKTSLLDKVRGEPYFKKYTSGGNPRKIPYTPENVLREMTRTVRGGEGINYGLGSTRARGAKKFKSISEIQAHRDRVLPREQFEEHKEDLNHEAEDIAGILLPFHGGGGNTHALMLDAIADSYKKGKSLYSELKYQGFKDITPEVYKKVAEFASKLKTAPTEYFESKPQRIVGLHEFHGAAVPEHTSQETLDLLKQHGVRHIVKYKDRDNDRARAIREIAEKKNLFLSEADMFTPLAKREPPKFPKLGIPDARKEVELINDPKQLKTKFRTMAHSAAKQHYQDGVYQYNPETKYAEKAPAAKETVDSFQSQYKKQADSDLKQVQDGTATIVGGQRGSQGYALSGILRPARWGWTSPSETESHGTKQHEEFHAQMDRVQDKHGRIARRALAGNLYNALSDNQRAAVDYLQNHWAGDNYEKNSPAHVNEEKIARLFNHINSPHTRASFHEAQELKTHELPNGDVAEAGRYVIPGMSRLSDKSHFDSILKDAHKTLLAAAEVADEKWLKNGHTDSGYIRILNKNDTIEAMLGFNSTIETFCRAAEFMSGKKIERELLNICLKEFEGDVPKAILKAFDIPISIKNIDTLKSIASFKQMQKKEIDLERHTAVACLDDGTEVAKRVQQGFDKNEIEKPDFKGKHSKGVIVVGDWPDKFLLKPGSGKESPASGAREESASQSEREAGFWHIANLLGLGEWVPRADLLLVDGKECAAIALLPNRWENLSSKTEYNKNLARKILEPYRESGVLYRWAVLDWILGQTDRHAQNMMVGEEENGHPIRLIDHGSAFAGDGFSPGRDKNSFVPYYLRIWSHQDWSKLSEDEKIDSVPEASAKKDLEIKEWIASIDIARLAALCQRYGVQAKHVIKRLEMLKKEGTIANILATLWIKT